jgi:L-fuculose-phosphate aldolase
MTKRLRQQVIDTALTMNAQGINQGTAGNVSARHGKGYLITPSGMAYDALRPDDVVFMDLKGKVTGTRNPSSEWRFHLDIYAARPEVGGIVHTHSPHATSLACLGKGIPAFHYMVAVAGGADIRCAPYATFGTQELSDHALKAMEGRKACLLANHGMIACGHDVAEALKIAVEVETLAAQYWRCLQIGEPVLLPAAEMERVLNLFKGYGKQPAKPRAKRSRTKTAARA